MLGRGEQVESTRDTAEDRGHRPSEPPRHALQWLLGRATGDAMVVLGSEPVRLGRNAAHDHDVKLDDPRVSRNHAEIMWLELQRAYWVRDLGSRNGVHLNGRKIARELLRAGDLVRIGDTVFRFVVVEPRAAQLAAPGSPFVGRSRSLRQTVDHALRLAPSTAPVLIAGETGTGKELIAGLLQRAGGRPGPLVAVNCAALPGHLVESELFGHERGAFSGAETARPGLFRAAHNGTLFLDEVGELPLEIQAKLLRAVEAGSVRAVGSIGEVAVQARIVAATNRDLAAEVAAGRFRADLHARLAESMISVDPLRARPEDLEPLWHHFVAQIGGGAVFELSGAAFEAMALHRWPWNVRELRQLVRAALIARPRGGLLELDDLPAAMRPSPPERPAEPAVERPGAGVLLARGEVPSASQLRQLVEGFHGSVKDVAAFLGKDRKQVYRWLRRDRIDPAAYRRRSP